MDLNESMTILADGKTVTLPLINFLRITLVKMQPLMLQYQEETKQSNISGFYEWMREKLEMKGANVLL